MALKDILLERSGSLCELCESSTNLQVYAVPPSTTDAEKSVLVCDTCMNQLDNSKPIDANHWRCLNKSMWTTVPGVQVVAWRMLNQLKGEGWTQDLLDMLYLDDETLSWAKAGVGEEQRTEELIIHKDSNGSLLLAGDTVVLIKDLDVKGGGFTAKRGTTVKSISLVDNNADQIEGRVNGQQIVILTKFVKKAV